MESHSDIYIYSYKLLYLELYNYKRKTRHSKAGPNVRRRAKNRKTVRLAPMSVDVPTVLLRKAEKLCKAGPNVRRRAKSTPSTSRKTKKQKNCKAGPNFRRRAKSIPLTSRKTEKQNLEGAFLNKTPTTQPFPKENPGEGLFLKPVNWR